MNRAKFERGPGRGIDQGRWDHRIDVAGLERGGHQPDIWGQASAHEPMAQPLAAARVAALDRPDRPSQVARGLLVGSPLEVAKDHGRPETIGQPVDLFVENSPEVVIDDGEALLSQLGCLPLVPLTSRGRRAGARRGAECNLMEPRAQGIAHPEAASLLDQDEERGLKCILAVVWIIQHTPADAQDHRSMPLDQGREGQFGGLAALGRKEFEELTVGQIANRTHFE